MRSDKIFCMHGKYHRNIHLTQVFTSYIGQFVHPVGVEVRKVKKVDRWYSFLASCEYHFFRVHENHLVQHLSNNISIALNSTYNMFVDWKILNLNRIV